jgi:outer membrane protein TolC
MSKATGGKSMAWKQGMALGLLVAAIATQQGWAQQAPPAPAASSMPVVLTLKRAVEMSLSNSKDIQLAKLQVQAAQDTAQITRAEFLPNLYAGSGAGSA